MSARALATNALHLVLARGKALDVALLEATGEMAIEARDRAYAQALCFAALRQGFAYQVVIASLVQKKPESLLEALLMIGFADIAVLGTADFAAVNEAVSTARQLNLAHAAAMMNAVMRRFAREQQTLLALARAKSKQARSGLPTWLERKLRASYPEQLGAMLEALQQPAPMWLRVHPRQGDARAYLAQLQGVDAQAFAPLPQAFHMPTCAISSLPGFAEGLVSVQDGAAQLAAHLLAPKGGERILDACAAPGGKTAHLLELAPNAIVLAVDSDATRMRRVTENLQRLGLNAQLEVCDAAAVPEHHGQFDAILLDAPCTATGVIRRHPDIAWLRRESDVTQVLAQQRRLLDALWLRLNPGGRLLYATCSILPEENAQQVADFLARTPDARVVEFPKSLEWFGSSAGHGRQNLPGQNGMDGFFYAIVAK